MNPDILFSNATVITMNADREVLTHADVFVQEGRITHVGPKQKGHHPARRVVDCSGKVLLPGLIHGHLHVCQTLFRNQADGYELLDP